MATTSTIADARQALVTALDTGALQGNAYYAWPGPIAAQMNEACWVDRVQPGSWSQEIAGIKPGRKHRQESYTFEVVIWVAEPHGDASSAKTTFERAVELCQVPENALADDVQLGETSVQFMVLEDRDVDLVPYDSGWACQVVLRIHGEARLT